MSEVIRIPQPNGHPDKTITLASSAGFCYGVKRAVDKAFSVAESVSDAVTLGPIIHNPQVVGRLAFLGVPSVADPHDTHPGQTVIIRSHGVGADVIEKLGGREIIDCTCPHVARIHKIAREVTEAGEILLIAGNPSHPEVEGIRAEP